MIHRAWTSQLAAIGVKKGDLLLVHSSLRSLGVPNAATHLWIALQAVLGPDGTLLVPALSYTHVHAAQPRFDPLQTPSSVGGFSTFCLQQAGGSRSLHPTHSVWAYGPAAARMTAEHIRDRSPVGPHSPFRRLRDHGGKILMVGCGLHPNTSMHGVEEEVVPPYLFGPRTLFELKKGEESIRQIYRTHDFEGYKQRYERIEAHMPAGSLQKGSLGQATCFLLDARTAWDTAYAMLLQDPLALVEKKEPEDA